MSENTEAKQLLPAPFHREADVRQRRYRVLMCASYEWFRGGVHQRLGSAAAAHNCLRFELVLQLLERRESFSFTL